MNIYLLKKSKNYISYKLKKKPCSAYDTDRALSIYGREPIKPRGTDCKKYKKVKKITFKKSLFIFYMYKIKKK